MQEQKIKVLYIAGWGRSGSTILARILGEIDGFFHGGELRTIWVDGLKPNGRCGCGVKVRECDVWSAVLDKGFGGIDKIDPAIMTHLRRSSEPRTTEVLSTSLIPSSKSRLESRLEKYQTVLDKLYGAIENVTGCKVIVDDSNHPGYAYTLAMMPGIDLYVVHLIRDPRATAYSWSKRIKKGLGTYNIRDNSLGWFMRNFVIEVLQKNFPEKYLRIFYEDFATAPQSVIKQILDLLGEKPSQLPFVSENEVKLGLSHTVFGNPNRTQTGVMKIRTDDEWKTKLDRGDNMTVTALTFPMLMKYGYFNPIK